MIWNGEEFIYDENLSTTPEISEKEELQRFLDKAKSLRKKTEKKVAINKFIDDMLDVEYYFNGYNTTYKDWTPLITEIDEETIAYHDSNLFFMAYARELEKKYDVELLDDANILLRDFDEYFAKRAEKDGVDILMITLIEDFYIEKGLLPQKKKPK